MPLPDQGLGRGTRRAAGGLGVLGAGCGSCCLRGCGPSRPLALVQLAQPGREVQGKADLPFLGGPLGVGPRAAAALVPGPILFLITDSQG